jgi:hypothetical protein
MDEGQQPQYYVDINEIGNIIGFYVDVVHGDKIPETAITITDEEWQVYCADANLYKREDGAFRTKTQAEIDAETPPSVEIVKTADQVRIETLEAEKAALEAQLAQLNGDLSGFIDFYFTVNPEHA